MGISRRRLFKGIFGLAAGTALAPLAKCVPEAAPLMAIAESRAGDITIEKLQTAFAQIRFEPTCYFQSIRIVRTKETPHV